MFKRKGGNIIPTIFLFLKGMAMGGAEVIPGVSGGTIAFISGIYEQILLSIKAINGELFKNIFRGEFKKVWDAINGGFIVTLASGMLMGIIIGIFGIGHLMEVYPSPLWGFFFGLIIASSIYVANQIDNWSLTTIILILLGVAIAYGITQVTPVEGTINYIWIFFCGFIAISALILPGVSGSFLLLILGMYTIIRGSAEEFLRHQSLESFMVILSFAMGCLVGLATFARVMSYAFKHYKNRTLAILTGFMLGSLWKIWPWQNPVTYLDKYSGVKIGVMNAILPNDSLKLIVEKNVLPSQFNGDPQLGLVIISALSGFIILFAMEYLGKKMTTH